MMLLSSNWRLLKYLVMENNFSCRWRGTLEQSSSAASRERVAGWLGGKWTRGLDEGVVVRSFSGGRFLKVLVYIILPDAPGDYFRSSAHCFKK